tara:strand:- start:45 stop:323 length:279 start_codon:yes stop_codon:yes gene_type:complete
LARQQHSQEFRRTHALQLFIDEAVAVVVDAVADLCLRLRCVAVYPIAGVTRFDPRAADGLAWLKQSLIYVTVAVVVHCIALLGLRVECVLTE